MNLAEKSLLTVFVVDDESVSLDILASDLRQRPEVGKVYTYTSYAEATLPLLELQPDVLFLDVEMPGCTGLDFLDTISGKVAFPFRVVFYTAYSHYMLDAIRRSAADFLQKPYKLSELCEVVERMAAAVRREHETRQPARLLGSTKIAVQTIHELLLVSTDEILMLQYQRDLRSWMVTLTDRTTRRLHSGSKADSLLALHPSLVRVSTNCIVNVAHLSAIEHATQRCRFCPPFDDIEVYASRRYYVRLRDAFELI